MENEELTLDTPETQEANRVEQRIRGLNSEKAKAEELAAKAEKAAEKSKAEAEAAKKDLEFFKNFNTTASKYPGAADFQDKIKEKAALGLSLEEATQLVMVTEGKYTPPPPPPVPRTSPAGGSAPTTLTSGEKSLAEMSQAERRAQLVEAQNRGDIGLTY